MKNFFAELKQRNPLLFWFGLFNMSVGLICILLICVDDVTILDINRWIKPMKFYFSVGLMAFTMNWILYYLNNVKKVKWYSWLITITMLFENGLILMQAIRGTTSHFNVANPFNGIIFSMMGILILIFSITCIFILIHFFRQSQFTIPVPYLWGIRLGLLLFILFSLEGGIMVSLLKHTVGATDEAKGYFIINWSKYHGDLRVAHFAGIHALQILPLLGFYFTKTKRQIITAAIIYFVVVSALLFQALNGIPLFF